MSIVYTTGSPHFKYQPQRRQKHCIFLHGWDAKQNIPFWDSKIPPIQQLKPFEDYLKPTLKAHGWLSHRIVYPSQLPFPLAAKVVCDYFIALRRKYHLNYTNTVFIGYSTGGLVARTMASYYNFPCTSLLTLASPHQGIRFQADFLKAFPSVKAMFPNSSELNRINNDYLDEKLRVRHHYFGVTFTGHGGIKHHNDGLVDDVSAVGSSLQNVGRRTLIHIPKRSGGIEQLVHNTEALSPRYVSPFLNQCATILRRY